MERERVTTKIDPQALRQLKIIAALSHETMIDVLSRLIASEYTRLEQQRGQKHESDTGL